MDPSHKYFDKPSFDFPRIPENTQGEDILGSFCRQLGIIEISETQVGGNSKDLFDRVFKSGFNAEGVSSPSGLDDRVWRSLVENQLASPIAKKDKGVVRMFPIVPEVCRYSAVTRYKGNPWNPGGYLLGMLSRSLDSNKFHGLLESVRSALTVQEGTQPGAGEDDLWARFVESELRAWRRDGVTSFQEVRWSERQHMPLDKVVTPDKLLAKHVPYLIELKPRLTRRKWVSIVESYLRLVLMLDVFWVCQLQKELYKLFVLDGDVTQKDLENRLAPKLLFSPDARRKALIDTQIGEYSRISFLLASLFEHFEAHQIKIEHGPSIAEIVAYFQAVHTKSSPEEIKQLIMRFNGAIEGSSPDWRKKFDGKNSRANNLKEFLENAPKRQQYVEESKSAFDQGFWFDKMGPHKAAPWVWRPGPVAVFLMVYLNCCEEGAESVSTNDHIEFLAKYGLNYTQKDLVYGDWGKKLRSLGLVVSSPDADGGIMIRTPFSVNQNYSS